MLNIITNGYILPFITKPKLAEFPDSLRIQGPSKDLALACCIQSLLPRDITERVENVNLSGVYSHLCLVPKPHQRWRPVIDLSRLNIFLLIERFKVETPEAISASLIPGQWVSFIDLLDAFVSPSTKLKKVPMVLPRFSGVQVHLPPFWPSHGHTSLYNDCKGSEADGPHKGSQTSAIPGRLADHSPVPRGG